MELTYTQTHLDFLYELIFSSGFFSLKETFFVVALMFPAPDLAHGFLDRLKTSIRHSCEYGRALHSVSNVDPALVAHTAHMGLELMEKRLMAAANFARHDSETLQLLTTLTHYIRMYFQQSLELPQDRFEECASQLRGLKHYLADNRVGLFAQEASCAAQEEYDMIEEIQQSGDINTLIEDAVHTGYRLKWEQEDGRLVETALVHDSGYNGYRGNTIDDDREFLIERQSYFERELHKLKELGF